MANLPSIDKLIEQFKVSNDQAKLIREFMTATNQNGFIDAKALSATAYEVLIDKIHPLGIEEIANLIPSSHGHDYIPSRQDSSSAARGLDYVNMGDTYITTIINDKGRETWRIASWGNIVETYPNRFD